VPVHMYQKVADKPPTVSAIHPRKVRTRTRPT
jgi:hypothetical protein